MLTLIPLPASFISSTTGYMADIISDLSGYLTLVIGVILGVIVVEILINALRK